MSDIIHDFYESNHTGKLGEYVVLNYLNTLPNIKKVKDVSFDKEYQEQDIDYLVTFTDKKDMNYPPKELKCSIEIKTDTYTTGNIFFETISNRQKNTKGCMYQSKADYLFYYFINFGELFILQLHNYVVWFDNHYLTEKGFTRKIIHNEYFDSVGYIFSREKLRKQPFCKVIALNMEEYL